MAEDRALRIAITGGIGAGKSLVAGWLRLAGHEVLDADQMAQRIVNDNAELRRKLAAAFGPEILDESGRLDRAELGRRAFAGTAGLERLNALVFPYLARELQEGLARASGPIFVDAALVFEWDATSWFDEVWVVHADEAQRLARASVRLGLPEAELRQRMRHQLPQEEKMRRASRLLENNGAAGLLWDKVKRELERLELSGPPVGSRPGSP